MNKTLILLFIALGLWGCSKDVPAQTFGQPSSASQIRKAQEESLMNLNPLSVKTGQRVHSIETQEIISSQQPTKFLSKEWVIDVVEVEDTPVKFEVTTNKIVSDRNWEDDFVYQFKDVYLMAQAEPLRLLDQINTAQYDLETIVAKQLEAEDKQGIQLEGVAYFNLKKRPVQMVPPEAVKKSADCKGLKDCKIPADLITYDIVFLFDDGSTRTHNVEWFISSEVPFFASILKQCASTLVTVESQSVLVKQCTDVVDFDYSTP